MSKPTLKDIANKTNVSVSTVSRILNHDLTLKVTNETRQAVLAAAEELSYIKPKLTNTNQYKVALINWYTREQEIEDNYYLSIRLGIEEECHKRGIELVKIFFDDIDQTLPQAHGAIAIGKFDEEEISIFNKYYEHIVFVDSSPDEQLYDSIVIDFESAYLKAINYLEELGFTDIGYIGGREYTHSMKKLIGERRELFFRNYFKNQSKIHIGEFTIESGYQLMKEAIKSKNLADAYLIASDAMAIGALRALYEANLKVPDDVSIVGFNDIPQSAYTIPPLTTIKVYKKNMGQKAVQLIIDNILGKEYREKILISTKLIIRKSTKELDHETKY